MKPNDHTYFANRECKYYPCHKGAGEDFNCLCMRWGTNAGAISDTPRRASRIAPDVWCPTIPEAMSGCWTGSGMWRSWQRERTDEHGTA